MASSQRSKYSRDADLELPELGARGWLRWIWRQLTSMRTALLLLLLLAAAAIPGSVYPQRSADPNGVTQFLDNNPSLGKFLDTLQLFDVYTSVWFSAIYILLFVSLIGCVLPRTRVHFDALRAEPPVAPKLFSRMPAHASHKSRRPNLLAVAESVLRDNRYRVVVTGDSIAAERGYLRETGNLIFHFSLIGVLLAVGLGGGFSYSGQRVLVEGETFVNNLTGYDSISPGAFFNEGQLVPFKVTLDKFAASFDLKNRTNIGTPLDFRATVTSQVGQAGKPAQSVIRVNEPLGLPRANVYLTGNGYAPAITIRDAAGNIVFSGATPFLPQDANYTSLGVIKVPDAKTQFGLIAFFYPTAAELTTGALTSTFPAAVNPMLTANVYVGDLGLDSGKPQNVYSLDIKKMKQVAGGKSGVKGIRLTVGQSTRLPGSLGTITFDGLKRFASLDVSYNPGEGWVLFFALSALGGLVLSLLVPRRRVWVRKVSGGFEIAALARGDDPTLEKVIEELADEIKQDKDE
ncbi:MAG: cytochrome c biogenesis protein ResB [Micrococcales bacterium]